MEQSEPFQKSARRSKLDFAALPLEVIQRIIEKCSENDCELLDDDGSGGPLVIDRTPTSGAAVQNTNGNGRSKADADDGWETEEEDGDDDPNDDASDAGWPDDKPPDFCYGCQTVHHKPVSCKDAKRYKSPVLAVHALALTCRALRTLALPYLYETVDFEGRDNSKVQYWIDHCLSKYGHFTKNLWIRTTLGQNEEFHYIDDQDRDDSGRWDPYARLLLASKLLRNLPNLISIDIDFGYADDAYNPDTELDDYANEILKITAYGSQLRSLCLTADATTRVMSTQIVGTILEKLPNLVHLELSGVESQSHRGRPILDILANMPNLKRLELEDCQMVNDTWPQKQWQSRLEYLELEDCQHITEAGVHEWLQQLSSSLKVLSLLATPMESGAAETLNNGPMFDMPQLWHLEIDMADCTISFLERFALCPKLVSLDLGYCDMITLKDVSQLIVKYRSKDNKEMAGFPALKSLQLSEDWGFETTEAAITSLDLVCTENGIAFRVEPGDGDGDEEDFDTEDEIDMVDEEDPEGYWEHGFSEDEDDMDDLDEEDFDDQDSDDE